MGDFPANPLHMDGHVLEFHDEFAGPSLDLDKWIPHHLPQWSSRRRSAARFDFAEGCLALQIAPDQPPWCPEFDGEVRVSSLQTGVFSGPAGSTVGQHRFNPAAVVREAQESRVAYAPLHGRFEMRARIAAPDGCHAALWMIGVEDAPGRCAEICICELFAGDAGTASSVVRFGVHPFGDAGIVDDFRAVRLPIDTRDFHVYAAEWTPRHVRFLVDNAEVGVVEQSPGYPMQFMLGLYERSHEARPGPRLPRFFVDYVRGWRPAPGAPGQDD